MSRTRRRGLWLALESSYAADPSTDGSGYLAVPTESLGDLVDNTLMHRTNFHTSRDWMTKVEPGADSAEVQFELPLYGNVSAAGDGTDASSITDDVWDLIWTHILGSVATTAGEGVATSSGTALTLDTDVLSALDHTLLYESGLSGQVRAQLRRVVTDNADGTYVLDRALDTNVTGAAVAYGGKRYRPNAPFQGGATFAGVYVDSDIGTYQLRGGRITSFSIAGDINERLKASITMRFDGTSDDETLVKTALPAQPSSSPIPAIQLRWSPLAFGGTAYDLASINLDLGLTAAVVKDTDRANGRSGDEMITMQPVLTINPLRQDAVRALKKTAAEGILDLQLGGGILTSGRVNAFGITFFGGQVVGGGYQDDEGHARHELQIEAVDAGTNPLIQVTRF